MKTILMIGLGRFGTNTSRRLCELGHEVMGVDRRRESVENAMRWLTSGQIGDSTDEKFLRSLGVRNFDICFVSMGDDFKSSLVTTTLLKELGVSYVVAVAEEDVQELKRDFAALRARLDQIPEEREKEIAVIERHYSNPRSLTFPAAVLFLVPETKAWGCCQ